MVYSELLYFLFGILSALLLGKSIVFFGGGSTNTDVIFPNCDRFYDISY